MGTKRKPGKFDCYKSLKPDEPHFTLAGRDRLAPGLVEMWVWLRKGNADMARQVLEQTIQDHASYYQDSPELPAKTQEAMDCAAAMVGYRKTLT